MPIVDAATFQRDFGRYRNAANQEPVRVTSQGIVVGAFLSSHDLENYERLKRLEQQAPVAAEAGNGRASTMDGIAGDGIAGFQPAEEEDAYDLWFREKVNAALTSDKPRIRHDAAMSRIDAIIEGKRRASPALDR